jgi:hypothetical protein
MEPHLLNRIIRHIAGPDAQLTIGSSPALVKTLRSLRRFFQKENRHLKRARAVFVTTAILVEMLPIASSQILPQGSGDTLDTGKGRESICSVQSRDSAQAALRLVCKKDAVIHATSLDLQTIVIGFVGGFANPADTKHPEVLFADYLREHYGSHINAKVFSNHDASGALDYVMELLDTDHDRVLSEDEKNSARVIIFGHSWGASETVAFARRLQHHSIPVLLTIQVDIVSKHGQHPSRIPSNVESAINFYQSEGFLTGQSKILASDASRTEVIGNFRSTYREGPVNCNNYPWLARTFNKPHHEIENDPRVWSRIASLIDAKISGVIQSNNLTKNISTYNNYGGSISVADETPAVRQEQ